MSESSDEIKNFFGSSGNKLAYNEEEKKSHICVSMCLSLQWKSWSFALHHINNVPYKYVRVMEKPKVAKLNGNKVILIPTDDSKITSFIIIPSPSLAIISQQTSTTILKFVREMLSVEQIIRIAPKQKSNMNAFGYQALI